MRLLPTCWMRCPRCGRPIVVDPSLPAEPCPVCDGKVVHVYRQRLPGVGVWNGVRACDGGDHRK